MGIITIKPNKISGFQNWYTSSGTPVGSGSVDFINEGASHPTVDNTYISNSGNDYIYLHFKGDDVSPYSNINSAILRTRMCGDSLYNGGAYLYNSFTNTYSHETVKYLLNEQNQDSLYGNPYTKLSTYQTFDNNTTEVDLASSGSYGLLLIFSTIDFTLNVAETAKYNYLAGTVFKDCIVKVGSLSGLCISSAEILLDCDEGNGFAMNVVGGDGVIRKEDMRGVHLSNMRYFGNESPHPTGFFSYYTFFEGSGNSRSKFGFLTSKEMQTSYTTRSVDREQYNFYTNPIPMTSGHPSNYVNGICMEGSGSNPGCFYLEANNSTILSNAWTYYLAFFPKDTNDINDEFRPLLRYGGDATGGYPDESFCFYIEPNDGGHALPYDYLSITYKTTGGTVKVKNLYSSNFKPFHNASEPIRTIITYSGESFASYNNPSGTINFYVEDNSVVDEHKKAYFRYMGSVSDEFYNEDRLYDSGGTVSIGGTPQFNGGLYSLEDNNGKTIFTEVGHNFLYYSGIKTVDSVQYLDSPSFEKLVTSRKNAQDYISESGDGKYVSFDFQPMWTSGNPANNNRVEFIHINIGSGNPSSYEMINSRLAHDGYITINPSSTYVEYMYDVHTNHPSGVDLIFNVNNNSQHGNNGCFSFETNNPSGTYSGRLYNPKIYGGDAPQLYGDDENIFFDIIMHTHPGNYTTRVDLHYARLYIDNITVATTGTNSIPLYTTSSETELTNSLELYLEGYSSTNNDIDLFLNGHISTNESTYLYIKSGISVSGQITMYTDGIGVENTTIPMYVAGPTVRSSSGNIPLYLLGTANSGESARLSMYMEAEDLYSDRVLPLVITGSPITHSSSINLFIRHDNEWSGDNFDLYLKGPGGATSGVPFHITGLGTTSGSIPLNTEFPLFIARGSEDSTDERLRLFIGGPEGVVNSTSMYIAGAYIHSSSIPMSIEGSPIDITASIKNYIHGF